eukprot:641060-Pleurochrysis_carterae.AAC.3
MVGQVQEDATRRIEKLRGRTAHGSSTKHADGVCYVWPFLREAIQQSAIRDMCWRWIAGSTARCCFEAIVDSTMEGMVSVAGAFVVRKHVGTPSGLYVWTRLSMYLICVNSTQPSFVDRDVHVERVGDWHLVRLALREAELLEPRGERSLPPAARLRHAVVGFLNAASTWAPVAAVGGLARRRVAVKDFSFLEFPLQVRRYEVPAPHAHACVRGDNYERPQGCAGLHRGTERLIVIHPLDLSAALDAVKGFESPAAFALVYPDEADGATGGDLRAIDNGPTAVAAIVLD